MINDSGRLASFLVSLLAAMAVVGCGDARPTRPPASPLPSPPASASSARSLAPSVSSPSVSPQPDPFNELASRPLVVPAVRSGTCPVTPVAMINELIAPASGMGPTYAVLGAAAGRYDLTEGPRVAFERYQMKTLWVSTDPVDEHILVRVVRVDSDAPAPGFAAGEALDATGMPTQMHLGPEGSVQFGGGPMPAGWRAWSSGTLVPDVGCYSFQIDTVRATQALVFEVVE
jgi:hypothetical protein